MRRGVWVVLGLVGMAPVGALAQQSSGQACMVPCVGGSAQGGAGQAGTGADEATDDTSQAIIVEMPATGERRAGDTALGQARVRRSKPGKATGTGGSGVSASPEVVAGVPNAEIFQGTLRAVERGRLRMVDGIGRVYEFGLGDQTRIIGPDGEPLSWQVLREGIPVRTVTQPGEFENEVITLQVFEEEAPAPSR